MALEVDCQALVQRESFLAGVDGASFCFVLFTIPLVDVDFVVVVFVAIVGVFDVQGPWSGAVGGARLMDEAAPLLLEPNCLVGKDGRVPMMVPWELGIVSRWDTHGWTAATPQVSMSAWIAWLVLRVWRTCWFARRHPWEHSPFSAQVRQTGLPLSLGIMSDDWPDIIKLMVE